MYCHVIYTGVSNSGVISQKRNIAIAPSSHSVCKHYVGGATSSRKTDDRNYFRSPDIGTGIQIIDVSDKLLIILLHQDHRY